MSTGVLTCDICKRVFLETEMRVTHNEAGIWFHCLKCEVPQRTQNEEDTCRASE